MMRSPFAEQDDTPGMIFRDVILLALAGFVAIVLMVLPHLNPPTKAEDSVSPGNVSVEVRWPDSDSSDVDLWVQAPGDRPVGYSAPNGRVFNLLRDDLGTDPDLGNLNMETSFSRGAPDGEYTINLHLYRGAGPIQVQVAVKVRSVLGGYETRLYSEEVRLEHQGQELTVVRFALKDGRLDGPMHDNPKALRSAS